MKDESARVDAYIAESPAFARPIFERLRRVIHKACPQIEERIKWGVPSFEKDGMVCGFAAFKAHASFGFWRQAQLKDRHGILNPKKRMSFMSEKLTDVSQLPADAILIEYVKEAVALNEAGTKSPMSRPRKKKPEAKVPKDLADALKKNAKARATFEGFPPGQRREYVEWIEEAKQEETRKRRLAQAIEWMAEGKIRNWKYVNC